MHIGIFTSNEIIWSLFPTKWYSAVTARGWHGCK